MANIAAYAALSALGAMYVDGKLALQDDLKVLLATRDTNARIRQAERAGELSLFYILRRTAKLHGSSQSIYHAITGYQETWLETYHNALRMAAYFTSKGVRPGDVVAVDFTNKVTLAHIWMGLSAVGAAPAFINYSSTNEALQNCVKISGAKLLVADPDVLDKLEPVQQAIDDMGIETVVFDEHWLQQCNQLPLDTPTFEPKGIKGTDMACIFYTSGTTGFPKAASYTLGRWWGVGYITGVLMKMSPQDRFFTSMPLYHGTGISCFIMSMFHGGCFCLSPKFSVSRFWNDVRASKATIICYVGETCRYLMAAPPSPEDKNNDVHTAYGLGLRKDIWEAFRERFGIANIMEFYGSTEGLGTGLNYNSGPRAVGSAGKEGWLQRFLKRHDVACIKVDPDTEEPFRDSKGLCYETAPGEPGELVWRVRDISQVPGYYKDFKATSKKFLPNVRHGGDLWFRSGDLLTRREDGCWYFIDRLGDTFRWKSENVSTMEVTSVLSECEDLADVSVYGVSIPRHEGRAGCAAVILKPSADGELRRLAEFAIARLPKYAVPLFLREVKVMLKTENNKLQKGPFKREGVNPDLVSQTDRLFWLQRDSNSGARYVPFTRRDWLDLEQGTKSL